MSVYCITHSLGDIPKGERPAPCFHKDEHYPACDGAPCRGCLPRSTAVGKLCATCWERYEDALGRVAYIVHHLRSIENQAQPLGERVSTSREPKLPIPDAWLAADGILETIGVNGIPSTASIDDAGRIAYEAARIARDFSRADVTEREGATNAVLLVRRMHRALARWPDTEAQRRHVPHVMCLHCESPSLYRVAPTRPGGEMTVTCATFGCGFEDDWFTWWEATRPYVEAAREIKKSA